MKTAWGIKRRKPYTVLAIKRLCCIRCGAQARFQWQICSDGNNYRPFCIDCDIALNRLVLAFVNHPDAQRLGDGYELMKRVEVEDEDA